MNTPGEGATLQVVLATLEALRGDLVELRAELRVTADRTISRGEFDQHVVTSDREFAQLRAQQEKRAVAHQKDVDMLRAEAKAYVKEFGEDLEKRAAERDREDQRRNRWTSSVVAIVSTSLTFLIWLLGATAIGGG